MSSTIKAIERHMTLPVRGELGPQSKVPLVRLERQSRATQLVAEWQQRGPETLSGHVVQKLRLALAPMPSAITPTPVGAG